jgi:hypothetical protein
MSAVPWFVTADNHLGHGNPEARGIRTGILKHTDRPWPDIEAHDEAVIRLLEN